MCSTHLILSLLNSVFTVFLFSMVSFFNLIISCVLPDTHAIQSKIVWKIASVCLFNSIYALYLPWIHTKGAASTMWWQGFGLRQSFILLYLFVFVQQANSSSHYTIHTPQFPSFLAWSWSLSISTLIQIIKRISINHYAFQYFLYWNETPTDQAHTLYSHKYWQL